MSKVLVLLQSLRFWQLTLASAAAFSGWVKMHGFDISELLLAISAWLTAIATVGTIDKLGKSVGGTTIIPSDSLVPHVDETTPAV